MVEAFEIYVGGTLTEDAKFNEKLKGKIEADDLGDVLVNFLQRVQEEKLPGETFQQYYLRVGRDSLQETLDKTLNEKQQQKV